MYEVHLFYRDGVIAEPKSNKDTPAANPTVITFDAEPALYRMGNQWRILGLVSTKSVIHMVPVEAVYDIVVVEV